MLALSCPLRAHLCFLTPQDPGFKSQRHHQLWGQLKPSQPTFTCKTGSTDPIAKTPNTNGCV